jgi:hypothetical protein
MQTTEQLTLRVDFPGAFARPPLHDLYDDYVRYVRRALGGRLMAHWQETRMATPLSSRAS